MLKLYLIQFFNDLKKQKLRVFLTLFGIIWGSTALILLISFGEGLKIQMLKNMHGMGEQIVIIWPGATSLPYKGYGKGRQIHFSLDDEKILLQNVKELKSISGEMRTWDIPTKYKKQNILVQVAGIEPQWGEMRNVFAQKGGRFINRIDIQKKRRVVFLGDKLKKTLFGEEDAIGKQILIQNTPFTVIGILQHKIQNSSYSGRDEDKAFIPITTFMALFNKKYLNNFVFTTTNPELNQTCINNIRKTFSKTKIFDPNDTETIVYWDTGEMEKFINSFTLGMEIFLGIVGLFTLIVAGIGVANIMNVIVEERTKEIGIKLAIGIKRKAIFLQFIFESFILSTIGGSIGFLISVSICELLKSIDIKEYIGSPTISPLVVIVSVSILGIIAFLSGYSPAKKAVELNPVEALRW